MKISHKYIITLIAISLCLGNCSLINDNAIEFRTTIETKAALFHQSLEFRNPESVTTEVSYFPKSSSPLHFILIPSRGASKTDLFVKKVPSNVVNGIFQQMQYLDIIHEDYISGSRIIVWDVKKQSPSWTGSLIQPNEILYVTKQEEEIRVVLKKVGSAIEIVSMD